MGFLTDIIALVGEVQASPTSNTVLDRLKALLTGIVLAAGTNSIGGAKDNGPHWTPSKGKGYSADCSSTAIDVTSAPASGQKIIVDDLIVHVVTACTISIFEESNATSIIDFPMTAGEKLHITARNAIRVATADKKLQIKTSIASATYTWATWHAEA